MAEPVLHLVVGGAGVARQHDDDDEQRTGQHRPAGAEQNVQGSALHERSPRIVRAPGASAANMFDSRRRGPAGHNRPPSRDLSPACGRTTAPSQPDSRSTSRSMSRSVGSGEYTSQAWNASPTAQPPIGI